MLHPGGFRRTTDHGKYLGIPSFISRSKRKTFEFLKDSVWARKNNWNNKKLSRVGNEVLLKSVAQALPNYVMSVILLLMWVCHDIKRMFNAFWWGDKMNGGKGITWMRWDRLSMPKAFGGMGFSLLEDCMSLNITLLCKQGWKLLTVPTSLVAQVYRVRYFPRSSSLDSSLGSNPSYTWRSIWATRDMLCKHCRLRVGDGAQISITKDPWLPTGDTGIISSNLGAAYDNITIQSLMTPGLKQ